MAATQPEQLTLVETPTAPRRAKAPVPAALRLSERTVRVGLAGVASARAVLAEQAARRAEAEAQAGAPSGGVSRRSGTGRARPSRSRPTDRAA